jgi:orotate phosphoribosyltransferase
MELRKLFEEHGIVKKGHFLLTSGNHSDTYINKDLIFTNHDIMIRTIGEFVSICRDKYNEIGVITGPVIAGAILAARFAPIVQLPFVYPEKIDGRMEFRRGFDKFIKNKNVFIVEDIVTTGGSILQTKDAIIRCGGNVVGAACIWNRACFPDVEAIIDEVVVAYHPDNCPLCKKGIPLQDPKE